MKQVELSVRGRYVVGMWSVRGRYVVGTWFVCGRYVVGGKNAYDILAFIKSITIQLVE